MIFLGPAGRSIKLISKLSNQISLTIRLLSQNFGGPELTAYSCFLVRPEGV